MLSVVVVFNFIVSVEAPKGKVKTQQSSHTETVVCARGFTATLRRSLKLYVNASSM